MSKLTSSIPYRFELDGLRGIAILFVMAYHLFPGLVPNGYFGVDIFFVLSGYLISKKISFGLIDNSFSLHSFYNSRIKRIFPALIVVLITTYAFAWFILLPSEFMQLSKHILGGTLFITNFMLWKEAGYFDIISQQKPLIHLWSLGIEGQFYILAPIYFTYITKKQKIFLIVILTIITSFFLNYVTPYNSPTNYFLLHTRIWEFLIGAALGYFGDNRQTFLPSGKSFQKHQSTLGLTLIIITILPAIRPSSIFYSLIPIVGALLIINSDTDSWINRKILSNNFLVWPGLISFPLYLWHIPIFSFLYILTGGKLSIFLLITITVVSILLAWVTYFFIEQPLRLKKENHTNSYSYFLLILMFVIGFMSYLTYNSYGFPLRKVAKLNQLNSIESSNQSNQSNQMIKGCDFIDSEEKGLFDYCLQDSRFKITNLLIGDSKASVLFPGLVSTTENHQGWAFLGTRFPKGKPVNQLVLSTILRFLSFNPQIKTVTFVIATRSLFLLDNDYSIEDLPFSQNHEEVLAEFSSLVESFTKSGKKVILVTDNPTLPDPNKCLERLTGWNFINERFNLTRSRIINSSCILKIEKHVKLTIKYHRLLSIQKNRNPNLVLVYDTLKHLCDPLTGQCMPYKNNHILYEFTDHISFYAASLIGKNLNDFIDNNKNL